MSKQALHNSHSRVRYVKCRHRDVIFFDSPCAELSPYPSGTVSDASASSVPVVSSSSTTPSHSMMQSDFSVGAQRAGSSDSFTVKFQNDSE